MNHYNMIYYNNIYIIEIIFFISNYSNTYLILITLGDIAFFETNNYRIVNFK